MIEDLRNSAFFNDELDNIINLKDSGDIPDEVIRRAISFIDDSSRDISAEEARIFSKTGRGYYAHLAELDSLKKTGKNDEARKYLKKLLEELDWTQRLDELTRQQKDVYDELIREGGLASVEYRSMGQEDLSATKALIKEIKNISDPEPLIRETWGGISVSEYLDAVLETAAYFWTPRVKHVTRIEELERTGEMFGGLPWVSDSHPWPYYSEGSANKPYAPGLQLDLSIASKLSGIPLGDGLLQLWFAGNRSAEYHMIRTIPREVLLRETPHNEYPSFGDSHYSPDPGKIGSQITWWILGGIDLDNGYFVNVLDGLMDVEHLDKYLEDCIAELNGLVDECTSKGSHLFGVAEPVQAQYYDDFVRDGWFNLVELGQDYNYYFGGDGAGFILYSRKARGDGYEFMFYWDCG